MSGLTMEKSPFAGKEVKLARQMNAVQLNGKIMTVRDWWANCAGGKSWKVAAALGNQAALGYSARIRGKNMLVPPDDRIGLEDERVLLGRVDNYDYLVHLSEIRHEFQEEVQI